MKGILITTNDEVVMVDIGWDDIMENLNDLPEFVRRGPYITPGTVMLVADTGKLRGLPVNRLASWLYGAQIHGHTVVGDVYLFGEVVDPVEGADLADYPGLDETIVGLQSMVPHVPSP